MEERVGDLAADFEWWLGIATMGLASAFYLACLRRTYCTRGLEGTPQEWSFVWVFFMLVGIGVTASGSGYGWVWFVLPFFGFLLMKAAAFLLVTVIERSNTFTVRQR
jgi:hypothetical protein